MRSKDPALAAAGVELVFQKDMYEEEVRLKAKQKLDEVGVTNGSIVKFRFVADATEGSGLLPCTLPLTIEAFGSASELTQMETSALVKDVLNDFGRTSGWPIAPQSAELDELRSLKICQLEGITYIRNLCKNEHMSVLQSQEKRAESVGFSDLDFVKTLEWVREQAPIIIHVDLSSVGKELAKDTHYRNQFETLKSRGSYDHRHRRKVEDQLFGNAYHEKDTGDASSSSKSSSTVESVFDRVEYGTLNFSNNPRGVESAQQYGKDYFMLKRVRLRTTLTSCDSFALKSLGTTDYYAHVLAAYSDHEFKAALSMGKHKRAVDEFKDINRGQYKEAQLHGEVRLCDHIDKIVIHESHRSEKGFEKVLNDLQAACGGCEVLWMDEPEDMEKASAVPKSLRELQYEDQSPSVAAQMRS